MKLQHARGVRDIDPNEQILRQNVMTKLKLVFEKYGFVPLDTPILERYDILSAKFAAGEESDAMSEVYTLKDNGDRELGLRFDLTVPLARYVGMNTGLKLPFKRYQIGKVYRDAPVKAGRYREFTQCDVDIIGSTSMIADASCVQLALDAYKLVNVETSIKINNRKLLQEILSYLGVSKDQYDSAMVSVDKLDKYGKEAVQKELDEKNISLNINKFVELTPGTCILSETKKLDKDFLEPLEKVLGKNSPGLTELKELFKLLEQDANNIVFDPALARGLGYYTGTIFEVYAQENTKIGAIGAGGRYDNLIGKYLGKEDGAYPAVGISFGLDRIVDVLQQLGKVSEQSSNTQVFVIPIGSIDASAVTRKLRDAGINTDIDMMSRKLPKNIKYAQSYGIPYALFVGENELQEGKFKLKNLNSGQEVLGSMDELIIEIQK